jgi:hypothetical protein
MKKLSGLNRATLLGGVAISALVSNQALADNPGGWEYSVAPMYLWAKNIEGSSSIGGKEAPLSLDFKDEILENLDAAFAIHVEAKQGALTLFAEYNYAKLDPSVEAALGPIPVNADIEFKDTLWELGVAYAFADSGTTQWEVLGGLRYMDQELDADIQVGPLPQEISGGDDWWQGFGGFRVTTAITEHWSFRARLDLGYNDSNNKSGHAMGFFDYRFRDWGSFFAGYRFLDTDYDNRESGPQQYAFNADQQGPIFGLSLHF